MRLNFSGSAFASSSLKRLSSARVFALTDFRALDFFLGTLEA